MVEDAFRHNFDATATLAGGTLTVRGSSTGDPGSVLLSRTVVVQQGDSDPIVGPAVLGGKWQTSPPLEAPDCVAGSAVAVGAETYLIPRPAPLGPAFTTITWSQSITIDEQQG